MSITTRCIAICGVLAIFIALQVASLALPTFTTRFPRSSLLSATHMPSSAPTAWRHVTLLDDSSSVTRDNSSRNYTSSRRFSNFTVAMLEQVPMTYTCFTLHIRLLPSEAANQTLVSNPTEVNNILQERELGVNRTLERLGIAANATGIERMQGVSTNTSRDLRFKVAFADGERLQSALDQATTDDGSIYLSSVFVGSDEAQVKTVERAVLQQLDSALRVELRDHEWAAPMCIARTNPQTSVTSRINTSRIPVAFYRRHRHLPPSANLEGNEMYSITRNFTFVALRIDVDVVDGECPRNNNGTSTEPVTPPPTPVPTSA